MNCSERLCDKEISTDQDQRINSGIEIGGLRINILNVLDRRKSWQSQTWEKYYLNLKDEASSENTLTLILSRGYKIIS